MTSRTQVLNWANDDPSEVSEAYVAAGIDTELSSTKIKHQECVITHRSVKAPGVRVIKGTSKVFSFAGTLDESILRETFLEARDNASFATCLTEEFVRR